VGPVEERVRREAAALVEPNNEWSVGLAAVAVEYAARIDAGDSTPGTVLVLEAARKGLREPDPDLVTWLRAKWAAMRQGATWPSAASDPRGEGLTRGQW
jgi:hypothetical protein